MALALRLAVVRQPVRVDTDRDVAAVAVAWIWHEVYESKKITARAWSCRCASSGKLYINLGISFIHEFWFSDSEQIDELNRIVAL